jgi:hypothetical protein
MRRPILFGVLLAALAAAGAGDAGAEERTTTLWDLRLGTPAAELPVLDFTDYACGTDGGPPSLPLAGFTDFARCPAEPNGLHEVYVRYDDEMEYRARAMESPQMIDRYAGTRLFVYPVVLSVLFDEGGILRAVRAVTDDRATVRQRRIAYGMGAYVRGLLGDDGWACRDDPPLPGEQAIQGLLIKQHCRKTLPDGRIVTTDARLLRKPGQQMVDPHTHELIAGQFESTARMEIYDPAFAPAP